MKQLKENKGIERSLLLTMAVVAGLAWTHEGWLGVCAVGTMLAAISLGITCFSGKKQ